MPTEIAGDPAGLRAAAAQFRRAGEQAQHATELVHAAVTASAGGWSGPAHDAFAEAAASTGGRVAAVTRFVGAAVVLEDYAAALEPLRAQYAQAMQRWSAAGGDGVQPLDAEGQAAASRTMSVLLEQAREADRRAAEQMRVVAAAAVDEHQGRQDFTRGFNIVLGVTNSGLATAGGVMSQLTAAPGGGTFLPAGEVAGRWADVGRAGSRAGWVVGPMLSASGQYLDDLSNPNYGEGERLARAAAQGVTVGGSAVAGGVIGAAAGSLVPGIGTVVGFAGGVIVGYVSGMVADEANDDVVDAFGEGGDEVQDGLEDLVPW